MESVKPNGLRTFRPEYDAYCFGDPQLKASMDTWLAGVQSGNAIRCLMITGVPGFGKTALALAVAKKLGVKDPQEYNCASTRTIEDARGIIETFHYLPMQGDYRVVILDEAHQLTPVAQQAFYTPFEGLPPTTIVIVCTSDPQLLTDAFRRRTYRIDLKPYSDETILDILSGLPVPLKPKMMAQIARSSGGNPGKALQLAESCVSGEVTEEILEKRLVMPEDFITYLLQQDFKTTYLLSRALQEEDRKGFIERSLRLFDILWHVEQGAKVPQTTTESKWSEPFRGKVPKGKVQQYYRDLIRLQNQPIGILRAWAMQPDLLTL